METKKDASIKVQTRTELEESLARLQDGNIGFRNSIYRFNELSRKLNGFDVFSNQPSECAKDEIEPNDILFQIKKEIRIKGYLQDELNELLNNLETVI